MSAKVAIILQTGPGSHEARARAFHALVYSKELRERGSTVKVVFDGAATQWLAHWRTTEDPAEKRLATFFEQWRQSGHPYVVCHYWAGAFEVREHLQAQGEPLVAEYMDHPSVAALVDEGYQVWIL